MSEERCSTLNCPFPLVTVEDSCGCNACLTGIERKLCKICAHAHIFATSDEVKELEPDYIKAFTHGRLVLLKGLVQEADGTAAIRLTIEALRIIEEYEAQATLKG